MNIGYNFVEGSEIQQNNLKMIPKKEMGIIPFLHALKYREPIPQDLIVNGLESLLYYSKAQEEIYHLIKEIMIDAVNYMLRKNPIIIFVINDEIQQWDQTVIKYKSERIPLQPIFGGSLHQEGVNRYHAEINIQS